MTPKIIKIDISSPASVANIGAGYDCLALAVGLRNKFTMYADLRQLEPGEKEFEIELNGPFREKDASRIGRPGTNLFADSFKTTSREICRNAGLIAPECPILIEQEVNIPPVRGLGSSSSAAVAGTVAAVRFLQFLRVASIIPENANGGGFPDFKDETDGREVCASLAMAADNCPDNVCASLSGGLTYSFKEAPFEELISSYDFERLHYFREPIDDPDFRVVALVPELMVRTDDMRKVLEESTYEITDVSFNITRSTCIPAIFRSRRYELLCHAMRDKIHQIQRAREYLRRNRHEVNLEALFREVIEAGAYGVCISGSGSTLVAFCRVADAEKVESAFRASFKFRLAGSEIGIDDVLTLRPDNIGVECSEITELAISELSSTAAAWARHAAKRNPLVVAKVDKVDGVVSEEAVLDAILKTSDAAESMPFVWGKTKR